MDAKYMVTVLTPTYNRKCTLPKLYDSLCQQTCQEFQWLVIDDGSQDGTEAYFGQLKKHHFLLEYYRKENGGKHTAINYAHPYIRGEVVLIADSDDYLLPEAVETVAQEWPAYRKKRNICGMSYLKQEKDGTHYSCMSPEEFYIADEIKYRVNNSISGDRCEVVRTEYFFKYPFPVFQGENFMSEGWLWMRLGYSYQMVYRNKALYVCEYLEDGLTKAGRRMRFQNPFGMMENCRVYFHPAVSARVQIKEMMLYWVYGKCAGYGMRKIMGSSGRPVRMALICPLGMALYWYWMRKYACRNLKK